MPAWQPATAARCLPRAVPKAGPDSVLDTLGNTGSAAFPRDLRLTAAEEFRQVFANSARCHQKPFTVLSRSNALGHARLGMAISKRNVRLATQRHRIKRLIRESFRHHQNEIAARDLVVLCNAGTDSLSNQQLSQALEGLWLRVNGKCRKS